MSDLNVRTSGHLESTLRDRQLALEDESVSLGIEKYRADRLKYPEGELPPGLRLTSIVVEPLTKSIEEWVINTLEGSPGKRARVVEKLVRYKSQKKSRPKSRSERLGLIHKSARWRIEPDVLAFITARCCINAMANRARLQSVSLDIGTLIRDEVEYNRFEAKAPALYRKVWESLKKKPNVHHRRTVMMMQKRKAGISDIGWTPTERVRVGELLIDLMIQTTGLVEIFCQTEGKHKTMLYLQGTDMAVEWIQEAHTECELLSPMYLPMVVKPKPWASVYGGGYLKMRGLRLKLVKTRNRDYIEELKLTDMPLVYRALNSLQDTAWRINPGVLAVLKQVWESGGSMGKLPTQGKVSLPQKPLDIDTNEDARRGWKRQAAGIYDAHARARSKRFSISQKLFIAGKFVEFEEIYFPHVLDWRSRAYPVPSLVNPQGDDTGRALLQFAHGKALGENGAYWLAVHGANLWGVDKVAFDERVAWVEENQELILDSAMNPLDGQRLWCDAEKPYQALAFCFEWAGYVLQGNSYESRLPIAFDGSCNGLQNFSAMLRDPEGGAATNLTPSEKPQDVYRRVADRVSLVVAADVMAGDDDTKKLAEQWFGKVTRKIVKRNVMTLPYGCKQYGMRGQIVEELRKSTEENGRPYLEGDDPFMASLYLSRVTYDAIGDVVVAARQAMDWLQETARVVASDNLPVRWFTPVGFPVLQSYNKMVLKVVKSRIGQARVETSIEMPTDELDRRKQAQGIAPNFVHSMDASHMMLTLNKCLDAGMTEFAMVHDSYGCPAADGDTMSALLREAFIEQYSGDVLGDFMAQLVEQLPPELAEKIKRPPPMGTLDLEGVREAAYFFA
jgi:DNA-directed RNA polymerase